MTVLNGKVRLGRQGDLVLLRIEQEGKTLRTLQFPPAEANDLSSKIDELVAVAATRREAQVFIQWGEAGVTSMFPLTEAAELARNMRLVASGKDIGKKLPMEPEPLGVTQEEGKMITDFCDPYYQRGQGVVHALRDLLLERAHREGLARSDKALPADPKPGVKITSNTRASWAIRLLQEALDNATAPEQWVGIWRSSVRQAIEAAEREQRGWPLLLRLLADEAYRNGYSAALKREKTGEFKTTGDIEVLIARAAAQVKP